MPPPISSPVGQGFREQGSSLSLSTELPRFGSSVRVNGDAQDRLALPYATLPLIQIPIFEGREALGDQCDYGFHIAIGRLGGALRCGVRDGALGLAGAVDASWIWMRGFEGELNAQLGLDDEGWFLYLGTGPGVSANYAWTVSLDDADAIGPADLFGLYIAPGDTRLVISQVDVSWNASVSIGVPLDGDEATMFTGFRLGYVLWASPASFRCEGCLEGDSRQFSDFDPGWVIAVTFGIRGIAGW